MEQTPSEVENGAVNGRGELDRSQMRPVRVAMPATLVREMDLAIQSGAGGYGSRQEFITEAVQNHLVEVRYGNQGEGSTSEPTPPPAAEPAQEPEPLGATLGDAAASVAAPRQSLAPDAIRIHAVPDASPIRNELAVVAAHEPLYGFHNRDIPSIWALERLASSSPTDLESFYERTTTEAAELAAAFGPWEKDNATKVTALLPKPSKRSRASAEGRTFQNFAMGAIGRKKDDGSRVASGPFFLWGVAGLREASGRLEIGVSDRGVQLLERLQGLTFALPHRSEHAHAFLDFLREWAPDDRWGFSTCLAAVAEGVDRVGLEGRFKTDLSRDYKAAGEWKPAAANSIAQGYLGRCREWGLVKPGRGNYALTPLGQELVSSEAGTSKREVTK